MTEEEYKASYYLDMINILNKAEGLMQLHESQNSEKVKSAIRELIAIYYSKPFISSNRAYTKEDGSKYRPHKLTMEEIKFSKKESKLHEIIFDWRNGYVAHSDQEKREQDFKLEKNGDGRVVGFEGMSNSSIMPLFDFNFELLKVNITKIKNFLLGRIYS